MIDFWSFARFLGALLFVLALIGGATWLARRYMTGGAIGTSGRRRLSLVETLFLDGKSRLVLVRRDDAEHLLVVGPQGAVVVEQHIAGRPSVPATAGARPAPGAE